jgi:hypothetical protein
LKVHKQIAKIESATLGFEDHGILTAMIHLDYGCLEQTIGGFAMSTVDEPEKRAIATPRAMDFVIRVLRACGAQHWGQLPGRTIYALFEGDHMPLNTMPIGIENLPFNHGETFMFDEWQSDVRTAQLLEKARKK